jgi:hypothetical protein
MRSVMRDIIASAVIVVFLALCFSVGLLLGQRALHTHSGASVQTER